MAISRDRHLSLSMLKVVNQGVEVLNHVPHPPKSRESMAKSERADGEAIAISSHHFKFSLKPLILYLF